MPIIEGVNADIKHIEETAKLIEGLDLKGVHLLPYHSLGRHKYSKLGREYQDTDLQVPPEVKMNQLRELLQEKGINVQKEDNREGLY